MTIDHFSEYLEYIDACSSSLRNTFASRNKLNYLPRFGGPAGLFKSVDKHPLCWGLLEMCNRLNQNECPLQYISFHKKGNGGVEMILNETIELLNNIHYNYSNIRNIPVANE